MNLLIRAVPTKNTPGRVGLPLGLVIVDRRLAMGTVGIDFTKGRTTFLIVLVVLNVVETALLVALGLLFGLLIHLVGVDILAAADLVVHF